MSAILINQQIVHYENLGRGRPVIFLHGWVGSWRYWIPVMQAVSVGYRAYALDLWGFGDTAKVQSQYSIDRQVALLDDVIRRFELVRDLGPPEVLDANAEVRAAHQELTRSFPFPIGHLPTNSWKLRRPRPCMTRPLTF